MLHKRAINDDDIDPDDALFTIPTTTTTTTTTEPPPPTPSFNPFGIDYDQQQQLNLAQSGDYFQEYVEYAEECYD